MKFVAYCPAGMSDYVNLLAAKVPVGEVDERIWIDALADRIVKLAERESNPDIAAEWACKSLDCVMPDGYIQLGQIIVLCNFDLRTHINLCFPDDPFPAFVDEDDEEALEVLEAVGLEDWVFSAQYMIGYSGIGISLTDYLEKHDTRPD